MAQDEDLQVLGGVIGVREDQQAGEEASDQPEDEEHRGMVRNAAQDTNQGFRAPQAEKPSPEFFAKIVAESSYAPNEIAYVRDRLDNDIRPALDD
jgi:hypothetical protein